MSDKDAMVYVLLVIFSITFVELFILLDIAPDAQKVIRLSADAVGVVKSKTMSDREKETFMRANSLTMFLTTMTFMAKFVLMFVILFGLMFLLRLSSKALAEQVMESVVSVPVVLVLTIVALLYVRIRNVVSAKL